jgi:two-component system cell cycle sensor histidine kinase/response regulator CckA
VDPAPQILLVDDEDGLRRIAKRALTGAGFSVITAADGQEALELYAKHAADIRLIITDITMPRLDGVGLHRRLREQGVRVPVLFTSGYAAQDLIASEAPGLISDILEKPWGIAELVSKARAAMSRSSGSEPGT